MVPCPQAFPLRFLLGFALVAALAGPAWADPVISEFMAANTTTLADDDGAYSDWIELHNPGAAEVSLAGWYLTDTADSKTRWQFPAVRLPAGGYLVVFASNKDRREPAKRLHTNFALDANGEYLALVKPDGVTAASEFAPTYPKQQDNVSFGSAAGTSTAHRPVYLARPTPGAPNTGSSPMGIPETVVFSHAPGPFPAPFSLTLAGAGPDQVIRYVTVPAADGAKAAEPTATSPLYSTPIAINGSTLVRAAVFSRDGASRGASRTVLYSTISPALQSFASTLPVFVIDTLGSGPLIKDNVQHPGWLHVYAPRAGTIPVFAGLPDLVTPLEATVRGSSSAEFPKKGYNFAATDELGRRRATALLNLTPHEKWALVAPWKYDLNYINNSLMYELSTSLGRWAPRTRLVEVYVNANNGQVGPEDYAGIYILTDRIELAKSRVDLVNLYPDEQSGNEVTGGYILKIDTKDPDEIGWVTRRGFPNSSSSSIVLVSPAADDIAPAQLNYIKDYLQRMEDALVASRDSGWTQRSYLDYIDRASWVDHHLLNTFAANPDALVRSAYFTKDRNSRLAAGPLWDFDRALGSYEDERSYLYDVWVGEGAANVWTTGWWGILVRDPEFMQDWVDRWQTLRRGELSAAGLVALVDQLSTGLEDAVVRDVGRWPDNAKPGGGLAAQLQHLRGWLTQRAEWIDEQFVASPTVVADESSLVFTPPPGAQLAYTLDGSDPRSLGGEIAPNAVLTSTPLTTEVSTNVHVRSYREDRRDTFPGTPWSSVVGGPASSPLAPAGRLINLSSRALVGSGEDALITGVVVADTESKRYLARAVGPTLATFGASNVIPDPRLALFGGQGAELARNQGWETGPDATRLPAYARSVGAFPLPVGSADSALAREVGIGSYTLQITTPSGRSGVGLAELYELDGNGRTINLSTRAPVSSGDGVLIGGFVVQGPAYKRMLIRAIGPTLRLFGVGDYLPDPVLTVYTGQTVVATNDRWGTVASPDALQAATRMVGAFALEEGSADAALLITLSPGAYTIKVEGKAGADGVALLEIYEVP